ncbi:hypothetical protein KXQ82_16900 [Mucilaginibacter sp. HMF5004]|uniref:hypothetical protein n=1 Tax=Mucilaginibacter rivuli TaxID=2857527 RepID=UPI001C5FE99B|nr:hypothetical protein [Mucilaginibacter rivuli]MBW4891409.1 hypothetical protein [Mucilaginibacter rivuli]
MFWYKLRPAVVIILLMAASCKPEVKDDNGKLKYFDLKKYFNNEAARLTRQYQHINKTVSYNGQQETKNVTIKHWQQELNSFIESDVNKAAWKDSYIQKAEHAYAISYIALDTTLHTRRIEIFFEPRNNTKVEKIEISNFTSNMLYKTKEQLVYVPDSIYVIEKNQKVRLLGNNDYKITGKFN